MNPANPHHSYGRIAPWPLMQNGRELTGSEAFDWYFQDHVVSNTQYLAANRQAYIDSLDIAIDTNNNLKHLPSKTKLMVVIPVSSDEGKTIYETLKLYAAQGRPALRHTQFVLIISQTKSNEVSKEASHKTHAEITRAQNNFPDLNLTLLSIHWPKTFANKRRNGLYGPTLKIVTDTCMRAAQRNHIDPLIITNDANPRAISKNYLLHYLRAMYEHPQAEVFLGKIHWDIGRMRSVPGYGFVATILMAAQDRVRESYSDVPLDSWAANSGYRASALAAIGGVDGDIGIAGSEQGYGADIDLGRRFFSARYTNDRFCMVHEAWIDSYGDRLLRQYLCNKSLTRAWDECDNNASSDELRLFVDMTENVTTDFDHIKRRIEHLLGLMFSDRGWVCFESEAMITAAMNTVLLGDPAPDDRQESPLWLLTGKRYARKITFTDLGAHHLKEVLPHLADIIQEGLATLDDTTHAQLRANKKFLSNDQPSALQKRHIGLQALTRAHLTMRRKA